MTNYEIAFSETNEILKQLGEKYISKIPKEILELIVTHKDKNHRFSFDINKKIEDQNIHDETIEVLAFLSYNYWFADEDKKKLGNILQTNLNELEEEKKKNYNLANMFKKKNDININNDLNELSVLKTKVGFWHRIINFIGDFIKK